MEEEDRNTAESVSSAAAGAAKAGRQAAGAVTGTAATTQGAGPLVAAGIAFGRPVLIALLGFLLLMLLVIESLGWLLSGDLLGTSGEAPAEDADPSAVYLGYTEDIKGVLAGCYSSLASKMNEEAASGDFTTVTVRDPNGSALTDTGYTAEITYDAAYIIAAYSLAAGAEGAKEEDMISKISASAGNLVDLAGSEVKESEHTFENEDGESETVTVRELILTVGDFDEEGVWSAFGVDPDEKYPELTRITYREAAESLAETIKGFLEEEGGDSLQIPVTVSGVSAGTERAGEDGVPSYSFPVTGDSVRFSVSAGSSGSAGSAGSVSGGTDGSIDWGEVPATGSSYIWPLPAQYTTLTSLTGGRQDPLNPGVYENHGGIDIKVPQGVQVWASQSGTVIFSGYDSQRGEYVQVRHPDGIATIYQHLSARLVSYGQTVAQGEVVGLTGSTGKSTGPHLHLEAWYGDSIATRFDPILLFPDLELWYGGVRINP